jgi:hypothetical protein
MGYKRTGRKSGAPFGNRNRQTHGRYSREALARRKEGFAVLKNALLVLSIAKTAAHVLEAEREGRRVPKHILELVLGGETAKHLD